MILGTEIFSRIDSPEIELKHSIIDCLKSGVNNIDTAECYGYGKVESMIGKLPKYIRSKIKVDSKFGHQYIDGEQVAAFSVSEVAKQLEQSLERLRIDRIQTYYFHSGSNSDFNHPETWSFLRKKQSEGVIENLGLSMKHDLILSNDFEQLELAHKFGATQVQCVLNPLHSESLLHFIPMARDFGMRVVARVILSKGLILKYDVDSLRKLIQETANPKALSLNIDSIINPIVKDLSEGCLKLLILYSWLGQYVDDFIVAHSSRKQLSENLRAKALLSELGNIGKI